MQLKVLKKKVDLSSQTTISKHFIYITQLLAAILDVLSLGKLHLIMFLNVQLFVLAKFSRFSVLYFD